MPLTSDLKQKKWQQWNSTLKRKPWNRSKRPAKVFEHPMPTRKPKRKGIRSISKKLKKRLTRDYFPLQKEFLQRPENRWCAICLARSLDTHFELIRPTLLITDIWRGDHVLIQGGATLSKSTEVHHAKSRVGSLLTDERFFLGSCRDCREFPHTHYKDARRLGVLAPAHEYGVVPRD